MNAFFADMLHFSFHFVCSFIINKKHRKYKILASSRRNNSKFSERPPTCLADPGPGKSGGSGDTKQAPQSLAPSPAGENGFRWWSYVKG